MAFRIASAFVQIDADTARAMRKINSLISALTLFGPAAGAASNAAVAGVAGLTAAFSSAGIAVGAFGAAAAPQIKLMNQHAKAAKKVADAQEAAANKQQVADRLAAEGSLLAGKAQESATSAKLAAIQAANAYTRQTKDLPKGTAQAALAFAKLKTAYTGWATSLSGSTMPVFTKAFDLLRSILPTLSPLVRTASAAFGQFIDRLQAGVDSGGLKRFMASVDQSAKKTLPSLLSAFANIGSGLGGMLKAFGPFSVQMAGGLERLTARFAAWGRSLGSSQGFQQFLANVQARGPQLLALLSDLVTIVGNIIKAMAPFTGASLAISAALASIVANTPIGVLQVLLVTITGVTVAMRLWVVGAGLVRAANALMASSAWLAASGWLRMNAVALGAYARIAAAAIASAASASAAWVASTAAALAGWARMMAFGLAAYARIAASAIASAAATAAAWAGSALASIGTWAAAVARTAIMAGASYVMMAARAVAWAAVTAASWLVAMGPIGWIIAGITAVIAVIVLIATKTTWFQTAWQFAWGAIQTAAAAAWEFIKAVVSAGFEFVKLLFLNFSGPGLIIKHWQTIKTATQTAWNFVTNAVSSAISAVRTVLSSTLAAIQSGWNATWNAMRSASSAILNGIRSTVAAAINAVRSIVTSGVNAVRAAVTSAFTTARSVTSSAFSSIRSLITSAINAARSAVSSAVSSIGSTLASIRGRATGALAGAGSWLYSAGQSIIRGLVSGIRSMAGAVTSAVHGIVQNARNLLPFSPAKEGPFSGKGWTLYSGQSMMQGLAEGITSKAPLVHSAAESSLLGAVPPTGMLAPSAPATPAGARIDNLNIAIGGSWDFASATDRRRIANTLVVEIKEALRRYDKERA